MDGHPRLRELAVVAGWNQHLEVRVLTDPEHRLLDQARSMQVGFPQDDDMTDLELWDRFESEFPDTFPNAFELWCQKPVP